MKRSIKYFNYCKLRGVGSIFPTKQGIRIRISFFAKYQRGWNWDNYFSSKLRAAKVKKKEIIRYPLRLSDTLRFPVQPLHHSPFFFTKKGWKKAIVLIIAIFSLRKKTFNRCVRSFQTLHFFYLSPWKVCPFRQYSEISKVVRFQLDNLSHKLQKQTQNGECP